MRARTPMLLLRVLAVLAAFVTVFGTAAAASAAPHPAPRATKSHKPTPTPTPTHHKKHHHKYPPPHHHACVHPSTVAQGDKLTMCGNGFAPNTYVRFYIGNTKICVGHANVHGYVTCTQPVPCWVTPGQREVDVQGKTPSGSDQTLTAYVTVTKSKKCSGSNSSKASLASSVGPFSPGSSGGPSALELAGIAIAGALVLAGGGAHLSRRRRRPGHAA